MEALGMSELQFDVETWLDGGDGEPAVRATFGALSISGGLDVAAPLIEVEDTLARTVRRHIRVPAYLVAEWLLINWWRLRWEGPRERASWEWRQVHCLSGIGGDHAWPSLEFSSDGDFVHLNVQSERAPDVAAVRYLRNESLDVPALDFESAVDRFVDMVEARVADLVPKDKRLSQLRAELSEERGRPSLARVCRWQALAGIDPGTASEDWLTAAETLAQDTGTQSSDEVLSAIPDLKNGLNSALNLIEAMKHSSTTIDLSTIPKVAAGPRRELPWVKGARLAQELRSRLRSVAGPLTDGTLGELLSSNLPLAGEVLARSALRGGIRNGVNGGRTAIVLTARRPQSQRFYLARLIAAAIVLDPDQHVVPITDSGTALQKIERSFAQEFLCPWASLDAFTDVHGTNDEGISEAAEYFQVTEWVVLSTLVNRGKLSRNRLPHSLT
jgi:hypothetical protein